MPALLNSQFRFSPTCRRAVCVSAEALPLCTVDDCASGSTENMQSTLSRRSKWRSGARQITEVNEVFGGAAYREAEQEI